MPDTVKNLRIQWKGITTGPYSRVELEEMLAHGEISLIHRVEDAGRWQSVGEFLERRARRIRALEEPVSDPDSAHPVLEKSIETPRRAAHLGRLEKQVLLGYILCGTTFVLPIFATIPALWLAFHIQSLGAREPSRLQFILCTVFTVLGILFYLLLHYATYWGWV